MKKSEKEKNILDLKHQKLLNYLNIIVILFISSFATYLITNFNKIKITSIFGLIILIFIIVIFVVMFFEEKLEEIKQDIRKLK